MGSGEHEQVDVNAVDEVSLVITGLWFNYYLMIKPWYSLDPMVQYSTLCNFEIGCDVTRGKLHISGELQ